MNTLDGLLLGYIVVMSVSLAVGGWLGHATGRSAQAEGLPSTSVVEISTCECEYRFVDYFAPIPEPKPETFAEAN